MHDSCVKSGLQDLDLAQRSSAREFNHGKRSFKTAEFKTARPRFRSLQAFGRWPPDCVAPFNNGRHPKPYHRLPPLNPLGTLSEFFRSAISAISFALLSRSAAAGQRRERWLRCISIA